MSASTQFIYTPPVPRAANGKLSSFLQRIELREGRHVLARAAWHSIDLDDGVVQLVELNVDATHQRRGHASALLNETIAQSRALSKLARVPLRRIWVAIGQKSQVIARAFLTRHGFHHTSTVNDLLRDQDLLVYVRAFD
jgi:ribosomal protein S18 acetylase RimI-like enzyme